MPSVDTSIEVNAPVERVFERWTDWDHFPDIMEHISEVKRTGPDTTHWVAEVAGSRLEWDANTAVEPNRLVSWTATGDAGHSGRITFDPLGPDRCRIHVHIDYSLPSRLKEAVAETFSLDERAISEDLRNFREQIEGS